jgi:hypothetical protein
LHRFLPPFLTRYACCSHSSLQRRRRHPFFFEDEDCESNMLSAFGVASRGWMPLLSGCSWLRWSAVAPRLGRVAAVHRDGLVVQDLGPLPPWHVYNEAKLLLLSMNQGVSFFRIVCIWTEIRPVRGSYALVEDHQLSFFSVCRRKWTIRTRQQMRESRKATGGMAKATSVF